jgi:GTP-binding protein HflX
MDEIDAIYDLEVSKAEFLPNELAFTLADLTGRINREISVYINRKGIIIDVSIGDSATVSLPEVEGRRNKYRLSGVRCIHTHPNGEGMLSAIDINSLLKLRLDAMVALGVKGNEVMDIYVGIPENSFDKAEIYGPFFPGEEKLNDMFRLLSELDKTLTSDSGTFSDEIERAILVGLEISKGNIINGKTEGERMLNELEELAITAGVEVLQKILQRKHGKDSAYFVGKGMVEQLNLLRQEIDANVIIFDDELSGAQVRNIEEGTGVKVIDRATLILDIFAQRARSREGKLQVELAQLKYRLPRLIGLGNQLSRLGGGIGTRGPGEKKLEVDKRHIRRRILFLEDELKALSKRRELLREGRRRNAVPTIALVGYTNAGKSTLLNALCDSDIFAEDKLFATLDPTARKLKLSDGKEALLIDTVGFIRKLPHDLIEAFKSTLEEAVFADVLLHVIDVSSEDVEMQINVVNKILEELGAAGKATLLVQNKIDLRGEEIRLSMDITGKRTFEISAVTGSGLEELKRGIEEIIPQDDIEVRLLVPYSEGWVIPFIHENGKVMEEEYVEEGIQVKATINKSNHDKVRNLIV